MAPRFPRIARIRWDKPAHEADEVAALEEMIEYGDSHPLPWRVWDRRHRKAGTDRWGASRLAVVRGAVGPPARSS